MKGDKPEAEENSTSGGLAGIPSPSAASSDYLWDSMGEIDPSIIPLLNTLDDVSVGLYQGDEIAPSLYVNYKF